MQREATRKGFKDMKKLLHSMSVRQLILFISGLLSFLIFIGLYCLANVQAGRLRTQTMAKRWSEGKDVAQVSCFFSQNAGIAPDGIEGFRHTLDSSLEEASITQTSPNAGARLWADAYSADGKISLKSDRASLSADCLGVGGDFFLFHPLELLYGNFFSESDLNTDYCVIDEDAAWQLFGSSNVAGMTVEIGGIPHVISGVVKRASAKLEQAAGLDSTLVYVSYTTLAQLGQNNGINHYEIVMPNPVSSYAYNYVKEHIGVEEKELSVVENTTRYSLLNRLKVLGSFGKRSMNGKAIIYPYWENLARGYEDIIALETLFAALFLLYPTVLLVILIVTLWRHKTWTLKSVYLTLSDKAERKAEAIREDKKAKKEGRLPAKGKASEKKESTKAQQDEAGSRKKRPRKRNKKALLQDEKIREFLADIDLESANLDEEEAEETKVEEATGREET